MKRNFFVAVLCVFCFLPAVSIAGYPEELPYEVDDVFFHSHFEWDDLVFGELIPNKDYQGMADYCYFIPIFGKPHNFAFIRGYDVSGDRTRWEFYLLQYEVFPSYWNTWYNRIRDDSSAYSEISRRWGDYSSTDWLIFYYILDFDAEPISEQLGCGYKGIIFVYGRSESYTDFGVLPDIGSDQSWWKYCINDLYYYVQRLRK